jgi:hypothetical protein
VGIDDMIEQGFSIGNRNWWVMVYYDVRTPDDLRKVEGALMASGCPKEMLKPAIENLKGWNRGYTFSDLDKRTSIIIIGKATDASQMFDSIVHEMKHLAEQVGEYYGVDSREELSAYLQGEVGRNMWPAAAMVLCPKCNSKPET